MFSDTLSFCSRLSYFGGYLNLFSLVKRVRICLSLRDPGKSPTPYKYNIVVAHIQQLASSNVCMDYSNKSSKHDLVVENNTIFIRLICWNILSAKPRDNN